MYKATVAQNVSDLKRFSFGPHIFISGILGGLIPTVIGNRFGSEVMLYCFIFLFLFIAVWAAAGILKFRPQKGELFLTQEKLRLKWMDGESVEVALRDLTPTYMLKSYRPMGIFPKKEYIHLLLEGGPLGPRSYFFVHDGEYNTSQWEKLSLQRVRSSQLAIGA